jgi:hypothetical protein
MSDPGTADTPCGEQLDPASGATAALAGGYVTIRVKTLPLGPGWKEGEAICIDTGLQGCTYVSTALLVPRQVQPGRRRKPQDVKRWPLGTTAEQADAAIDLVCGCGGKYDCDCVSCFNKARGDAWWDHNTKPNP